MAPLHTPTISLSVQSTAFPPSTSLTFWPSTSTTLWPSTIFWTPPTTTTTTTTQMIRTSLLPDRQYLQFVWPSTSTTLWPSTTFWTPPPSTTTTTQIIRTSLLPDRQYLQFAWPSTSTSLWPSTSTTFWTPITTTTQMIRTSLLPDRQFWTTFLPTPLQPLTATTMSLPHYFSPMSPTTVTDVANNTMLVTNNSFFQSYEEVSANLNVFGNNTSIICGLPGICQGSDIDIYKICFNIKLLDCTQCGENRGALFLFCIVILGLAILIGNILTILVWYKRNNKGKATKMDICRSSLATADMMTGIQILVVTVYNFSWSMNLTPLELDAQQLALRGSTQAMAGAILNTFGYTSSLYHLIYMGAERFYAIAMPMRYKFQSTLSVYAGLGVVWILALAAASIPAWFPGKLVFTYYVPAFIFAASPSALDLNQSYTEVAVALILLYLVPYVLMTVATLATGIIMIQRGKRSKSISSNAKHSERLKRQTRAVYVTVAIMQLGFTIALVPVAVVIALMYTGYLSCSNVSLPYLVCFYLSMTNSLINVLIYNIRDKEFRNDITALFKGQNSLRTSRKSSATPLTKRSKL